MYEDVRPRIFQNYSIADRELDKQQYSLQGSCEFLLAGIELDAGSQINICVQVDSRAQRSLAFFVCMRIT
jgi:hypothetical protein